MAQLWSPRAALVAGLAALLWWAAVIAVPVIAAALLTTPDGTPVDGLGAPNGLTAMRAWSCAGLTCCAFVPTPRNLGFILWGSVGGVAALLDLLDGWIARRVGPITRLGQLLDPVMDCVFFSVAAVGNIALGIIPAWLGGLMLARYLGPLLFGIVFQLGGRRPELSATVWGKRNTVLTGAVLLTLYVVRAAGGPTGTVALVLGVPLLGTTTLLHFAVMARRERDAPIARPLHTS
ncbi:MAG TPA: CDP-alcohol phosphatidyltransferase family protein [Candidatus Dormibacteraeota bacterium]|nr:CDP-alcohol phosphatidyltransferase family protein [Candidatus Dormibacteraeota bacterium]